MCNRRHAKVHFCCPLQSWAESFEYAARTGTNHSQTLVIIKFVLPFEAKQGIFWRVKRDNSKCRFYIRLCQITTRVQWPNDCYCVIQGSVYWTDEFSFEMSELVDRPCGCDKWWMSLKYPSDCLGTRPRGLMISSSKEGGVSHGPEILPARISLSRFSYTTSGISVADIRLVEEWGVRIWSGFLRANFKTVNEVITETIIYLS